MSAATVGAILDAIARHWPARGRRRDHARGQSVERRGGALPRLPRTPASTACRSACSRSTTAMLRALGRLHTAAEALRRDRRRTRHIRALLLRPDLRAARPDAARPGATSWRRRWRSPAATSRSTSSPSSRARRSPSCTPAASSRCPTTRWRTPSTTLTQELTEAAGLPAYEISNHAAPGEECRHNLLYWRYGEYAGVGPGAHGRAVMGGVRHATVDGAPARSAGSRCVEARGHGLVESTAAQPAEAGRRGPADGVAARGGPRPRPPGARSSGFRPARGALSMHWRPGLIERRAATACAPRARAASSSTRSCCGCPRRWSRSVHRRAGRFRSVEIRLRASPRGSAEVAAAAPSRGWAAPRRRRRRTSAPRGWRARGRCRRPAGRRKAPSTPREAAAARRAAPAPMRCSSPLSDRAMARLTAS